VSYVTPQGLAGEC